MAIYHESTGSFAETAAVGPLSEGVAGIAVIVLTILGLAAVTPGSMAAISTIIIGIALMVEGANTAVEYNRVLSQSGISSTDSAEAGTGVTIEFLAGGAGIVLGILGLIGDHTVYLLPAALIVFGGALLLAGAAAPRVNSVELVSRPDAAMAPRHSEILHAGTSATRGIKLLIGISAVVLGILSYLLPAASPLLLVGLLAIGGALLATSATLGAQVVSMFATR